jgi:hypothetical protein
MKKLLALAIAAILLLLPLTACNGSNNGGGNGSSSSSGAKGLTANEMYDELKMLIGNPERDTKLSGEFTFTADIVDEAFDMDFGADGSGKYVEAYISRTNDFFLIEVSGISNLPEPGLAKVTGTVNGLIFWTNDGKQIKVLDIKSSKIIPFAAPAPEVNESPIVTISDSTRLNGNGKYEFLGAHLASTGFNNVVVIYFNYTNTNDSDSAPLTGNFYVYHGDDFYAEFDSSTPREVLSNALAANTFTPGQKTYAGRTQLYYMTVRAAYDAEARDVVTGQPVWIYLQNDDFQTTDCIGVSVFDTFEEFNNAE